MSTTDEKLPASSASPAHDTSALEKQTAPDARGSSSSSSSSTSPAPPSYPRTRWTPKNIAAVASLCGIWVGAQIPLYFVGGCLTYIVADLAGSAAVSSWLTVSYTLAIGAVSPFCGYLADIVGPRWVIIIGAVLVCVGCVVVGTARDFAQGCAGMGVLGVGAAVAELTALAGITELVPVSKRGFYLAICTAFLLPWTPYVMYSQLLSVRHTWRWTIWICLIYNCVCTAGLILTYFPHRANEKRPAVMEVLRKIDYIGGLLSITGITLFLVALGSGGYTHSWSSAYVLATLLIGIALFAAFLVWEWKFAANPILPGSLFRGNRVLNMAFLTAFVAGMNLYSLLNFFPLTFAAVFDPDPIQVGLKGLGYGISVTAGATIINALLSVFKQHNRELLVFSTILMTAFGGALAAVTPGTPRLAVALGTIAGFGVGGVYIPAATIALIASPDTLMATTVALSLSIRTVGGSIGYTIYYNVFATRLATYLPTGIAQAVSAAGLAQENVMGFVQAFAASPASVAGMAGVTPEVLAAATAASQVAYARALSYVWYVSIPFGVCSIAAAALIGDVGRYMSDRVVAKL